MTDTLHPSPSPAPSPQQRRGASDHWSADDVLGPAISEERRDETNPVVDERRDQLAPFGPAILAIRWATTMLSISLAAGAFVDRDLVVVGFVGVIVAVTAIRSLGALRDHGRTRNLVELFAELAIHLVAVTMTGLWTSPLIFSLMTTVVIAGFARGFAFGLRVGGVVTIALTAAMVLAPDHDLMALPDLARWSGVVLLVGIVAGYGRRISGEANRQHGIALDRMNRLADANALLFNLHRIAQTLPASLNQDEVLDSTIARLRPLVEFDSAAIITLDESDGSWIVARRQAVDVGQLLAPDEMPMPLRRAITSRTVVVSDDLSIDGPGFNPGSRSCAYAPLLARDALIGVLCLESRHERHFSERDADVLRRYVDPAALAIDNARWFARLRTVGADEERTRIARDLHDRIGQSLAYLGFELDRVIRHDLQDRPVTDLLEQLSVDLRGVTTEVRETLYDLRTDVGNDKDLAATLEEFGGRVAKRSSLDIVIDCDTGSRLPILQEREIWRIAQEALINIERHAQASEVGITWRCNGSTASLSISDNGKGFPVGKSGRQDSYGILGMRERASSIGATLELISSPGEGTTVRCFLAQ